MTVHTTLSLLTIWFYPAISKSFFISCILFFIHHKITASNGALKISCLFKKILMCITLQLDCAAWQEFHRWNKWYLWEITHPYHIWIFFSNNQRVKLVFKVFVKEQTGWSYIITMSDKQCVLSSSSSSSSGEKEAKIKIQGQLWISVQQ